MVKGHKTNHALIRFVLLAFIALPAVAEISLTSGLTKDKNTDAEARPKKLTWGEAYNGLHMAAWISPTRSVVFAVIRNGSRRRIHYCDYLLGELEFVRIHARKSPSSDWVPIPLKPNENRAYIGVLLCGSSDTLRAGREMAPNRTSALFNKRIRYTFDVDLASYEFPSGWEGEIECKISQTIFGGRHEDAYEGTVESPALKLKLPFAKKTR